MYRGIITLKHLYVLSMDKRFLLVIFSLQQVKTAVGENFVDIDSRIHMQAGSAHVHM